MQFLIFAIALCCASTFATPLDKVNHALPVAANDDSKAVVIVCQTPGQKIADIYDCTGFYLCAADLTPMHSYCQNGESFSSTINQCIFPYDPNQCANAITTYTPPHTVNPVVCTEISQIHPDPYDCTSYYLCGESFNPIFFYCESNLYYDPGYASCNIISRVSCSGGYRPGILPSATPVLYDVGPRPVCNRPADIYGNYYHCDHFWKCNQYNQPEAFKCPPDLHFDYPTSKCNFVGLANCIVRQAEDK